MSEPDEDNAERGTEGALILDSRAQGSSYGGNVTPMIQHTSTSIDPRLVEKRETAAAQKREATQMERTWKLEQDGKDRDVGRRLAQGISALAAIIIVVVVGICCWVIIDNNSSDPTKGKAFAVLAAILTSLVTAMAGYLFGRQAK